MSLCLNAVANRVRRLLPDTRGNVAIIFAFSLLPVILAVGSAIDYGHGKTVRNRIQAALDATGLMLAQQVGTLPNDEIIDMADGIFAENFKPEQGVVVAPLEVSVTTNVITLTANADVQTYLMHLAGVEFMKVGTSTEITRAEDSYEVVLVLDNTGSMGGSKIESLREASQLLVNNLFGEASTHPLLDMALVPFSHAVNVGTNNKTASWMDKTAPVNDIQKSEFSQHFVDQGLTRFDLYDRISNVDWPGCVEAREYPLDVNDTPASAGNKDTLFVPYFYPDEPGNKDSPLSDYTNSYLNDVTGSSTKSTRQKYTPKYSNGVSAGGSDPDRGPAKGCTAKPILPLTNKRNDVLDALQGMQANGYTNITEGLMWGLRVISPAEPFTEGKAYGTDDHHKIIILLTDGKNEYPSTWGSSLAGSNNHNKSQYGPYGFAASGRLVDTNNKYTFMSAMNDRTEEACEAVKDEDILLFTITFELNDPDTIALMRDCATEPSMYYNSPDTSTLKGVFSEIGTRISELRISK